MTEKFKNKYRIQSARLPGWDYSWNAFYFITMCSVNRRHVFGEIIGNEMILSDMGRIVSREWEKSFEIRAGIFCDAFVNMPNHIHAILRIEKPDETYGGGDGRDARPCVSTDDPKSPHGLAWRPRKSISSFVAGFKSATTRRINRLRNTPGLPVWQSRFHDHIIRDEKSYNHIMEYIVNNPLCWLDDVHNI